jgi:hypothetical protein
LKDWAQKRRAFEEELVCIKAWLIQHPNDQKAQIELTGALLGSE